ncbi:MAG: ubiquitin-conjugating enzyme E2 [Planctomycetota bacterium]
MRKSPRVRRLNSDYRSVKELSNDSSIFSFECKGNPPQRYRLIFNGHGLMREPSGRISVVNHHEVVVELGAAYPRMVPNLAWQTPIFHPNISVNGVVCLGSYGTHWVPSLTLSEMATMLWDMIRYQNFDSESPYNREAAIWIKTQTDFQMPLDTRSIRDKVSGQSGVKTLPVKNAPKATAKIERVVSNNSNAIDLSDGIEIIEAEVISPPSPPADDGIVFLD